MKFLQKIFSVKNEYNNIFKTKIFTILGIKIKLKSINRNELLNTLTVLKAKSDTQYKLLNVISSPHNCPKAKGELREKQLKMLEVLKTIDKICKENNLKYWIDFGTLLGAKRHKGFVPWDCDADVCMMREDYLKIIPLLHQYYDSSEQCCIREIYKCKDGTYNAQIRICNKGFERLYGVDIFPVDKYYKSNLNDKEISEINLKAKDAAKQLKIKYANCDYLANNVSLLREKIQEIQNMCMLNYNVCACESPTLFYALDFDFSNLYPNLTFNYDTIFPLGTIEFENYSFHCPNDIRKCLILHYGENFNMFPPKFNEDEDKIEEYIRGLI